MSKHLTHVILLLVCSAGTASAQRRAASVVVRSAEVRQLPATITLVGTVDALRRSVVGSQMEGVVRSMSVRQGDLVKKDALLIQLDDDDVVHQLSEARAGLMSAQSEERRWAFEMERIKQLYGDEQANHKEVYDTQADHDIARYTAAMQEAVVKRLETNLRKTSIAAPFTGFVVRRLTEVGEWVPRGGAVVEIADLSNVLIRVDAPESALPFIHKGDKASAFVDALARTVEGRVAHVIPQADPEARTFPVEIIVDNADYQLAAGMFARVTVNCGAAGELTAVPKDAVVEREGVRYVAVVMPGRDGGKVGMLRAVTTGADVDDWIAVTSGNIPPGTQVVVRGNERIFPFPSPVRVVDDHGKPVETASADATPAPGGRSH